MTSGSFRKDRAILVEAGANLFENSEWYVRFGRRQLLTDWLVQHTPEQAHEMFSNTATHRDIPLRILELFPIVEPKRIGASRVFFPNDLQELDVEMLRGSLDEAATSRGLQVEPESVKLEVRINEGIFLTFTALAR